MTGNAWAHCASGEGESDRRLGLGAAPIAFVAILLVALFATLTAGQANAATPVIVNTSSTGGQTNWLESFATGGEGDGGDNRSQIKISLLVKHDPGRKVTGIRVDDDYDGTNNTASKAIKSVTAQQPTVQGGYQYSRVSLTYNAPSSGTGMSCPVIGTRTRRTVKPLRVMAVLDNAEQTAVSTSDIKFTATGQCLSAEDFPYIKTRSQSATSVNTGQSVTFTYNGDDPDISGNSDFGGINYRLRRLNNGTVINKGKSCPANGDNANKTLTVAFPDRGRWVVEAELLNNNDCNTNDNSGYWWNLGTVDVNSPASSSPTLTLNATRPEIGGTSTVTATTDDPDDSGQGGRVEAIEWDLDQNTGNGVGGFEIAALGDTTSGITAGQKVRTINPAGMTPGPKTVRARVTDNGALGGADTIRRTRTATTTFLVDTPPVALPDSVRTVSGSNLPLALAGTDVDGDTLGYSITAEPDHGTLSGSGASRVYSPDPGFAGTDSFTFEVDDGYGGTSTADVSVRVDPDVAGFAGPDGEIDSRAGEIEFGSSVDGATFECSIDDSAWEACTSPWALTDLEDGEHTMRTRVTANGLLNPDAEAATWTVDAFPKVQIDDGPDAQSNSTGVAVDFSLAEAGATVTPTSECRLDDLEWAPCLSPATFDDLDDGDHTIAIRATDAFGKQSTETVEWTIVTAGSSTTINAPVPDAFTRNRSATINFSATGDVQSFECSLDGSGWAPCASPAQLTGLADGSHTFRVRSIDALGNEESLPAQISWTVDRVSPEVTITSGPNGPIPAGPAAFAFKSNESHSTFECKLDDADYVACSSPFRLPADLADGGHAFRVAAIDRAGNRSLAPLRSFRVLSAAPQVNLTGGPSQGEVTSSTAAEFGFAAATPTAGYECRIDGGEWAPCEAPTSMTGLLDGPHSFAVRAVDEVGNRTVEPTVRDWTVDTVAPETSITEGPAARTDAVEASFRFASSEPGSTFECSLDGSPFIACASPAAYGSLTDGEHVFRVRATDAAGNRDTTPATRGWTVDTTVPTPPDPPEEPAEAEPCTFVKEQESCGDPYLVASARAPFRKRKGKGRISFEADSGGAALRQVVARLPIGLRSKATSGKAGRKIGKVVLTGKTRTVLRLRLPRRVKRANLVARVAGGPSVTLKPRTMTLRDLPAGTTGIKIKVKSTRGLKVITSTCGTRLWRAVMTDADSNREGVDARADVTCVRKGNR